MMRIWTGAAMLLLAGLTGCSGSGSGSQSGDAYEAISSQGSSKTVSTIVVMNTSTGDA